MNNYKGRPVSTHCSMCGVLKTHKNTAIRTGEVFQSECRACKGVIMHIMGLRKKTDKELKATLKQHTQCAKRIRAVLKDKDTSTRDLARKLI